MMNADVRLRVVGSALVVVSYFIILHVSAPVGALGQIIGDTISLPFFIRTKAWDCVVMITFLLFIGLSKVIVL